VLNSSHLCVIHPLCLSLLEVAFMQYLRSRSAKSTDRFEATEVRA